MASSFYRTTVRAAEPSRSGPAAGTL